MKNSTAAILGALLAVVVLTAAAAGFGGDKPLAYKIFSTISAEKLSAQVRPTMDEGWVPLGEATKGTGSETMQTMLKD